MSEELLVDGSAPVEDADKAWRDQLPPGFRPVALRHGKMTFVLAYNAGAIQEAMRVLVGRTRGNNELMNAVGFIQNSANVITGVAMDAHGVTGEVLRECQLDIERAAALQYGIANTPGGALIVPH